MKTVAGLPHAQNAEPLALVLDGEVPDFSTEGFPIGFEKIARDFYRSEAERFVRHLEQHAPGGLLDVIFARLCDRMASVLRTSYEAPL